ncbi:MAG: hypothetical protein EA369_04295 [Bradymonadales bacterium]|nr:MAG: hypothetical protein EA369_04295 [Bradymonadales bacterium]
MKKKKSGKKKKSLSDQKLMNAFETQDTGKAIVDADSAVRIRSRTQPISLRISPDLVAKLRQAAAERDLGYQTMAKLIIAENIDLYIKRKPRNLRPDR